jgi:tRNA (guanine10-N2)-dimethyltransferase
MLPPKLARMMVNYSQTAEGGIIWDPFCGSGTVLMEALALGYTVIGTDVDPKAVEETKENLSWLCDEKWISHSNYKVFEHDITKGVPTGVEFDSIVTEPYLGPVLRDTVNVSEIDNITSQITPLFEAIVEIAAEKGRGEQGRHMVIVVPGFKTQQGWIDMDPFGGSLAGRLSDETRTLSENPLQWDRPNSIIRRNIKILAF